MSTATAPLPDASRMYTELFDPTRIRVQATYAESNSKKVCVAGRTIPIASGRLFLP
jgi:hypothetical protein